MTTTVRGDLGTELHPHERDVEQRAIDALLTCVARHGLAKTTLEDVAREAGCARATLYRYFGGKRQLVQAAVAREAGTFAERLHLAAVDAADLESAVVAMLVVAATTIESHPALQFLLTHEPELVLPHLTFDGAELFMAGAGAMVSPALAPHLPHVAPQDLQEAGEWVARILLTYLCSPDSRVSMTNDDDVRSLVRAFVVPGLEALEVSSRTSTPTRG